MRRSDGRRRHAWAAILVVLATVAGACGTSETPTSSAASAGASSTPGSGSPIAAVPSPGASGLAGTSPSIVDCAAPPSLPSQQVFGATTLHFVQSGCSIGISGVDLAANTGTLRKVTFDPPIAAGSIDPTAGTTDWTTSGTFEGHSALHSAAGDVTLDEAGTYQGAAHVQLRLNVSGAFRQYASAATASSERSETFDTGADGATGHPDNEKYGDKSTAWAPATKDGGLEWLELTYPTAVIPAGVRVWENFGSGFVTRIEAFDDANGSWTALWSGKDPTVPGVVAAFSPPLQQPAFATTRIRVTVDTSVSDWNEIDAVELLGPEQPAGWVVWLRGEWREDGTVKRCLSGDCVTGPWSDQPAREWMWAFDTSTDKVGETPDQVQ